MPAADEDHEQAYRLAVILRTAVCVCLGIITGGSATIGLDLGGEIPGTLSPAIGAVLPFAGAALFGGSYLLARRRCR